MIFQPKIFNQVPGGPAVAAVIAVAGVLYIAVSACEVPHAVFAAIAVP
jgi:hypothetical protein